MKKSRRIPDFRGSRWPSCHLIDAPRNAWEKQRVGCFSPARKEAYATASRRDGLKFENGFHSISVAVHLEAHFTAADSFHL